MPAGGAHVCHNMHMEDIDQREGIRSLLPTSGSWKSNSGCQAELVYVCVHMDQCPRRPEASSPSGAAATGSCKLASVDATN